MNDPCPWIFPRSEQAATMEQQQQQQQQPLVKKSSLSSSSELSGFQHFIIGALAGMTESVIQQPTLAVKNAWQQGRSVEWRPLTALYRGVGINCASIAPICGIQFGVNGTLTQYFNGSNNDENDLSISQRIAFAGTAGAVSALVGSPAELIMISQQRTGWGFYQTLQSCVRQQGFFNTVSRGLALTAMRDITWSASYLALGPVIAESLSDDSSGGNVGNELIGSIVAGLLTVVVTQPIDTVKTVVQGQILAGKGNSSATQVATQLYRESGHKFSRFWVGTTPRGLRLIGAVFILGQAKKIYENAFLSYDEYIYG